MELRYQSHIASAQGRMFGLSSGRDTGRDFVGIIGIGNELREIIGGDNSMTAGYWWGHVTSVHAKYTPLVALRADYGPAFTQRKGVSDPLHPSGPSLCTLQGPDVCLPKIVPFR